MTNLFPYRNKRSATPSTILKKRLLSSFLTLSLLWANTGHAQEWYIKPERTNTRWISFENPEGAKGAGGKENEGAKGHAFDNIEAGETVTLLEIEGAGIINRMWMTISDRSPEMLRSLRLDMYWDGAGKPAVSVPFGDFFGIGLGKKTAFETDLFSDPEGRSFNCFIPMPFREGARITLTNESDKELVALFYDINYLKLEKHKEDVLYFHAFWNREQKTRLKEDYEILPVVKGSGRFLGVNIGIVTDEVYEQSWWGEGEVKMYLDGDQKFPTIVGTGTEDYIGTAYGQGVFNNRYQGCLIADNDKGEYAFYRYHVPDPVYFDEDLNVTLQQIGGWDKKRLLELIDKKAPLIPISIHKPSGEFVKLLEQSPAIDLRDPALEGWVNFYRQDDVSSTAYFYLDKPVNNLPTLAPVDTRISRLSKEKNN